MTFQQMTRDCIEVTHLMNTSIMVIFAQDLFFDVLYHVEVSPFCVCTTFQFLKLFIPLRKYNIQNYSTQFRNSSALFLISNYRCQTINSSSKHLFYIVLHRPLIG